MSLLQGAYHLVGQKDMQTSTLECYRYYGENLLKYSQMAEMISCLCTSVYAVAPLTWNIILQYQSFIPSC